MDLKPQSKTRCATIATPSISTEPEVLTLPPYWRFMRSTNWDRRAISRDPPFEETKGGSWQRFYDGLKEHQTHFREITRLANLLGGGFMLPDDYVDEIVKHFASRDARFRDDVAYVRLAKGTFSTPMATLAADQCSQVVGRVGEIVGIMAEIRPRVLGMFDADLAAESRAAGS